MPTDETSGSFSDPRQQQARTLIYRQREVLQLLAELNITTRTVAFHKYRFTEEDSIRNHCELVRFAVKHHVMEAGPQITLQGAD